MPQQFPPSLEGIPQEDAALEADAALEMDAALEPDAALEMDDGPPKGKPSSSAPERMCIATRNVHPIAQMIRFVRGPEGDLVPDIRNKLPGRGCWVRADYASLATAVKRKAFARALKVETRIPDDLAAMVDRLLAQDALQTLSLANKAGAVVCGFAKIEAARGTLLALVQARDGSPAEIMRLQGLCRERGRMGNPPERISVFSAAQLALSLGYEHVIHAAIIDKDVGVAFLSRVLRLIAFHAGNTEIKTPAKPLSAS